MYEWILIMTMNLEGPAEDIRDISPVVVPQFTSQENCENAAFAIKDRFRRLSAKSRERQGIPSSSKKFEPSIFSDCIRVKK